MTLFRKFKRIEEPALALKQVGQSYPHKRQVLEGISFSVMPAEVVYLTGESGAGKTTLLKICSLLTMPAQGEVLFNQQQTAKLSAKKLAALRRNIGIVPKHPIFLWQQTVWQNLALPLELAGWPAEEIRQEVKKMLARIHLTEAASFLPQQLSSGEQACLSIARALIAKPMLVVADEPLHQSDFRLRQCMSELLMEANKFGAALLIATNDLTHIARSKARALFLKEGHLVNEEFVER